MMTASCQRKGALARRCRNQCFKNFPLDGDLLHNDTHSQLLIRLFIYATSRTGVTLCSNYERQLDPYFNQFDKEFSTLRQRIKEILHEEVELNEIVQLVAKDSLSEDQKLTLEIANIIKGEFLQQNAFSEHDFTCPLEKVHFLTI